MSFFERLLAASEVALQGSFGDLCPSPRYPHAVSALKSHVKFNLRKQKQSRNLDQLGYPRTLMYNRRTLSLTAHTPIPDTSFSPPTTLQDQADNSPPG